MSVEVEANGEFTELTITEQEGFLGGYFLRCTCPLHIQHHFLLYVIVLFIFLMFVVHDQMTSFKARSLITFSPSLFLSPRTSSFTILIISSSLLSSH